LDIKNSDLIFHPESMLRSWLKKRGKQHCIDFDDEELRQLRTYFNSLDDDGSGAIGVDELEDPLIALGLVENRQQVASIVAMVDEDGSQQIEFDEFLSIIKGGNSKSSGAAPPKEELSPGKKKGPPAPAKEASGSQAIFDFFKKLTSGELKVDSEDKIIPFSIFISTYRRKKILDAMMGKTTKEKEEGSRILNNYKKQLAERMARQRAEKGESLSTMSKSHKYSASGASSSKNSKAEKKSAREAKKREARSELQASVGEVMEPEILLRILFGKGNAGSK